MSLVLGTGPHRTVPPLCHRCGRPLRGVKAAGRTPMCRQCQWGRRFFRVSRAPTVYEGALKDYLHRFKYGGERELGLSLGLLVARFLEGERGLWPVRWARPGPAASGPA